MGKHFCKRDELEILAQTLVNKKCIKTQVKSILRFGSVSSPGSLDLLSASLGFARLLCMGTLALACPSDGASLRRLIAQDRTCPKPERPQDKQNRSRPFQSEYYPGRFPKRFANRS